MKIKSLNNYSLNITIKKMIDNLIYIFSSLIYILSLLFIGCILLLPAGTGIITYSLLLSNWINMELFKLIGKIFFAGIFYIFLSLILLVLIIIVVRLSFENFDILLKLKNKHYISREHGIKLFTHICYSVFCLIIALFINWYYDFMIIEIPLSVYICWILGFISSVPIEDSIIRSSSEDDIKDYLFFKSVTNTICYYILYLVIKSYI